MERKCETCAAFRRSLGRTDDLFAVCCLTPIPISKMADDWCMQYTPTAEKILAEQQREGLKNKVYPFWGMSDEVHVWHPCLGLYLDNRKPPEIDSDKLAQRIWNRLNYIPIDDLRSKVSLAAIEQVIDDYLKELKEK